MKCFGLSLSDQYWIKPINSKLTWDKINFFNNKFSNDIGEAFFNPNFVKESNEIDFFLISDLVFLTHAISLDACRL